MIAAAERSEQRILLHDVSWDAYVKLADDAGEKHVRFTYDDGDLEIMTTSFGHDHFGRWIGRLIAFLTFELDIPVCSGGSTTLRSSLRKKGLEPDECFWIEHESIMRNRKKWTVAQPPPDLVVEVDVTSSSLSRVGIYAALGVPEIWRFDGTTFQALHLGRGGKYREAAKSRAFPMLPIAEFVRFVTDLGSMDETRLLKSFQKWLRDEVVR